MYSAFKKMKHAEYILFIPERLALSTVLLRKIVPGKEI